MALSELSGRGPAKYRRATSGEKGLFRLKGDMLRFSIANRFVVIHDADRTNICRN